MRSKFWLRMRRHYKQRHLIVRMLRARLDKVLGVNSTVNPRKLGGWAPYFVRADELVWVDMSGQPLRSSASKQDFLRAARRRKSVRISGLNLLEQVAPGPPPSGFVFHIGRCGSTLLRNMLAATPNSLALSEPLVVHDLAHGDGDSTQNAARLTGAIRALCRPYVGSESRYYIKMASTCTLELEQFGRCFPETPAIFLYREPVEVMVAAIHEGSCNWLQARRNPALAYRLTGISSSVVEAIGVEEYAARVIGRYYEIVASYRGLLLPINYSRLLEPETTAAICRFLAIPDPQTAVQKMMAVSGEDAKRRGDYVPDSARRRVAASPEILEAAAQWCEQAYTRLDALSATRLRGLAEDGLIKAPLASEAACF